MVAICKSGESATVSPQCGAFCGDVLAAITVQRNLMKIDLTAFSSDYLRTQELIPRARALRVPSRSPLRVRGERLHVGFRAQEQRYGFPRAWSGEQTVRGAIGAEVGTLRRWREPRAFAPCGKRPFA